MNSLIFRLVVVVSFVVLSFFHVAAEEWTNLRGTSTVGGQLIGIWNGRAILRLDDGRQILVKLDDLKSDSRIQAQDLQVDIDRRIKERVAELDGIAIDAAAPAPPTLPTPKPAPRYQPPQDSADLLTALEQLRAQSIAGHVFRAYFDALPKSHQDQADEMMKLGLQKFDPGSWELARSTLHRFSEVAVTKQRWLFSHPKFASVDDSQREMYLTAAAAFRLIGTSESASLEKLQANPISDTVEKLDDVLAPYLHQAADAISLAMPNYEVETGQDGVMLAKVVLPFVGTIQSVPMVQLEGRWVEGKTAEEAATAMASYKTNLDAIPNGSIRLSSEVESVLNQLSDLVAKLEQAKNKTAFHRAIDDASVPLGDAIAKWAGVKSQPVAYGDDGTGSGMEMDMNMGGEGGSSQEESAGRQSGQNRGTPSGPPSR